MILIHGTNSIGSSGSAEYIRVGNLLWAKKNLDINVSVGNYVQVPWPDAGKLYKGTCIDTEITPTLTNGWRVPTDSDFQNLYNELVANNYFGAPNPYWALAITDNDYNYYYNGNYRGDTIGFKAYITGYASSSDGPIQNARSSCNFWTSTDYASGQKYDWCLESGNNFTHMHNYKANLFLCIRLCKDA